MDLNLKGSNLLKRTLDCSTRFLVHCGGARSSKTYSIAQFVLIYCLKNTGKTITIVRSTLPALRKSVFRDVKEVFDYAGQWNEDNFKKTELEYLINGNTIEFTSTDDAHKLRGRKRNLLWINEATDVDVEAFRQLEMRTTEMVILDYNPSVMNGWMYDLELNYPHQVTTINSTYKDNPFLEESVIRSIEAYRNTDPDFYRVFGLGLRGNSQSLIYQNVKYISEIPSDEHLTAIGLDFGWQHETAAVRVHFLSDRRVYEQLLYEKHLDTTDLVVRMKSYVRPGEILWCDSARPDVIDLLKRGGMDARSSDKSVLDGISSVRRMSIECIGKDLYREFQNYRWQVDNQGNITDRPVKIMDDLCDALRYAVFNTEKMTRTSTFDYDFASF